MRVLGPLATRWFAAESPRTPDPPPATVVPRQVCCLLLDGLTALKDRYERIESHPSFLHGDVVMKRYTEWAQTLGNKRTRTQ